MAEAKHSFEYPATRTVEQVDDYHGTKVADPYRWLEDADAAETKAWVEAQNKLTFGYLEKIGSRAKINARLTQLWNFERYGVPSREGKRYFFSKNDGLQNQSVLYWASSLDETPKVLIDPNVLAADGTVALQAYEVSPDGELIAYGLSASGSDWVEWRVREVATGKDRPDHIKWSKFSGAAWKPDGSGFFYSRYDAPAAGEEMQQANYFQKLYFHRLGDPQEKDELVYERKDQKEWGFEPYVTDDGRYLVVSVWKGTDEQNLVFYKDLKDPKAKMVELVSTFEAEYSFVDNDGPTFWFRTNLHAPRGRLIAIDTSKTAKRATQELVPQDAATLESASCVGDRFVLSYLKDAHAAVRVFTLAGKLEREVQLPGLGSVMGFDGERKDGETYYAFSSFTVPGTIYRFDVKSGASTAVRTPKIDFDASQYETKQVFTKSKDGTQVPIFITHKKGLKLDGSAPGYLYGYGGFNIPLSPWFAVPPVVWMEMGGVYAVANLRGGGEYGRDWHLAGTRERKQNVFDDFFAAAEYLIAQGYTTNKKLVIGGRSNGGLLVGAAITQRPELFGAALPGVGVMDMLRFHKFTIGWAWVDDYGSSENPKEFPALYAYSPYHNAKPGKSYPATLVYTADHDDRVVPGHSFKFTAALQAAQRGDSPVMIRIETKSGHGAATPTSKRIEEATDLWAFALRAIGAEDAVVALERPSGGASAGGSAAP